MDFPACILGETPELNADSLVIGGVSAYSWRNTFSCINLLRILNKLTKWKHSRIMMLVVFKSAPILKRTLKVRHAMMQLYVLKLLKMQTKYLGRQWRKTNMKTISAIYAKVRHRLNDDWAFGNDLDARPWDFQAEECTLRTWVDRFNNRRYLYGNVGAFNRTAAGIGAVANNNVQTAGGGGGANNATAAANNGGGAQQQNNGGGMSITGGSGGTGSAPIIGDFNDYDQSVLDANHYSVQTGEKFAYAPGYGGWDESIELSDEFKEHYEEWLQQEVFNIEIDWDLLFPVVEF